MRTHSVLEMRRLRVPPEEASEGGDAEDLEDSELVEGLVSSLLHSSS